jgi:hypothetical protein
LASVSRPADNEAQQRFFPNNVERPRDKGLLNPL